MSRCNPKFRLLAAISGRGSSYEAKFTLPSTAVFMGEDGALYGGNGTKNAEFVFSRLNGGFKVPMRYVGTYRSNEVIERLGCSKQGFYCCSTNGGQREYVLREDMASSSYYIFVASAPVPVYTIVITFTVGNSTWAITLDQNHLTGSWPPSRRKSSSEKEFIKDVKRGANSAQWSQEWHEVEDDIQRYTSEVLRRMEEAEAGNLFDRHVLSSNRKEKVTKILSQKLKIAFENLGSADEYEAMERKKSDLRKDAMRQYDGGNLERVEDRSDSVYGRMKKGDDGEGTIIDVRVTPLSLEVFSRIQGGDYVAVKSDWTVAPFTLLASAMSGISPGTPSYNRASFASDMAGRCSLAAAQSLVYYGGNPSNDAFMPYWTRTVELGQQYRVSILSSAYMPAQAPNNFLMIQSNLAAPIMVDMSVDTPSFALERLYPLPVVTNSGAYITTTPNVPTSSPSTSPTSASAPSALSAPSGNSGTREYFNIFVDLSNTARTAGYIEVIPDQCCSNPVDFDGNIITPNVTIFTTCAKWFIEKSGTSVGAGEAHRYYFQIGFVPYGQTGYCTFNISVTDNPTKQFRDVGFLIPPKPVSGPSISSPLGQVPGSTITIPSGSNTTCNPPNIKTNIPPFCISRCSIDQDWRNLTLAEYFATPSSPSSSPISTNVLVNASEPTSTSPTNSPLNAPISSIDPGVIEAPEGGICVPVNCFTKYKGSKNRYDRVSGLCKSTPTDITDPPSLSSPGGVVVPSSPSSPSFATPTKWLSPSFILNPDGTYSIACGPHGSFNKNTNSCVCDEGWITDVQQSITNYTYCGMKGTDTLVIVDQRTPKDDLKFSPLGLIVALLVLAAVIAIVVIVCCCCCRRKKRESSKKSSNASSTSTSSASNSSTSIASSSSSPVTNSASMQTIDPKAYTKNNSTVHSTGKSHSDSEGGSESESDESVSSSSSTGKDNSGNLQSSSASSKKLCES